MMNFQSLFKHIYFQSQKYIFLQVDRWSITKKTKESDSLMHCMFYFFSTKILSLEIQFLVLEMMP